MKKKREKKGIVEILENSSFTISFTIFTNDLWHTRA